MKWIAFLFLVALPALAETPVQVFILSGQSNMEGKAAAYTLEAVIKDPKTRATFQHLKPDGEWLVRDDVFVTYLDRRFKGGAQPKNHGPLTVGFGAQKQIRDDDGKRHNTPSIGPELGIGQVLGEHFDAPVLLIKAAWGGRSVKNTFRPPSAMPSEEEIVREVAELNEKRQALIERQAANENSKKKPKPPGPVATVEARKAMYGSDYHKVLSETRQVLDNLSDYLPAEAAKHDAELTGFIWFQGWNDGVGSGNPAYVAQMTHFIADMRRDLKAPNLPFVIGELGTDGQEAEGWIATFRKQQREIAKQEGFKGNVALAPTARYWPTNLPDLSDKWDAFRVAAKANEAKAKDDPTRIDPGQFYLTQWEIKYRDERAFTSDKRYHYHGSGACYYQMGESMGRAMVSLLKGP